MSITSSNPIPTPTPPTPSLWEGRGGYSPSSLSTPSLREGRGGYPTPSLRDGQGGYPTPSLRDGQGGYPTPSLWEGRGGYVPLNVIFHDVRVALNMNHACQALIDEDNIDTLTLNELIRNQIEPVAAEVVKAALLLDLGEGKPFGGDILWDEVPGHGSGSVILPPDFLRLVLFRMSGWRQAATLIDAASPRAMWQRSPFPGVHGNPCRPVAFISPSSFGNQLHFFASADGYHAQIVEARYIPVPCLQSLDSTDNPSPEQWLSLPPRLYHPFIQALAERVQLIIQNN